MRVNPIDPATVCEASRVLAFDPAAGSSATLLGFDDYYLTVAQVAGIYLYESQVERAARDTRELALLMEQVPA